MRRALFFVMLAACAAPKHPPSSGPVGASGTCLLMGAMPDGGGVPGFAGGYGYQFEDDTEERVNAIIEHGSLRELEVIAGSAENAPAIRVRPPSEEPTDQMILSGHAKELDVPLVVGQWATVPVTLSWNRGGTGPVTRNVRVRIVGMGAEAQIGDAPSLRGNCVWGPTDRDPQ